MTFSVASACLSGGYLCLASSTLTIAIMRARESLRFCQLMVAERRRTWVPRNAGRTCVVAPACPNILLIPGTSSVGHLRENLAVADLQLPPATVAQLDRIGIDVSPA